jgi:RNA polymerase sigma-70 factor (ECF subfamily)
MSVLPAAEVQLPLSPEQALQGLYERNADRILGFCRRRLRTQQEAEDALQETFVSALRALQRGCVPVSESAWLFKIAENVCYTMYRSGVRRNTAQLGGLEELERVPGPSSDGDSLFGLEEALGAIPPNQRRAFLLRELRGLSYREIALQLGVSVASVETLIFRARRGLAKALENGAGLRERISAALNAGSIGAAVKSWLAGATAAKVATATAVVAVAAVSTAGDAPSRAQLPAAPPVVAESQRPSVGRSNLWGAPDPQAVERKAQPASNDSPARKPVPQRGSGPSAPPVRHEAPPRDAVAPPETGPTAPGAASPAPNAPPPAPPPAPVSAPARPQLPSVTPPELPVQVPQVPPVQVPQLPELPAPELPKLPVEVPTLPDPGSIELPTDPVLP